MSLRTACICIKLSSRVEVHDLIPSFAEHFWLVQTFVTKFCHDQTFATETEVVRPDFCDHIWYVQTFATKLCHFQTFAIEKISREFRDQGGVLSKLPLPKRKIAIFVSQLDAAPPAQRRKRLEGRDPTCSGEFGLIKFCHFCDQELCRHYCERGGDGATGAFRNAAARPKRPNSASFRCLSFPEQC